MASRPFVSVLAIACIVATACATQATGSAANLALSAGAAALVYERLASLEHSGTVQLIAALLAGLAYAAVNVGLVCLAMGFAKVAKNEPRRNEVTDLWTKPPRGR